jgi:hypothetical protein
VTVGALALLRDDPDLDLAATKIGVNRRLEAAPGEGIAPQRSAPTGVPSPRKATKEPSG